MAHYDPLEDKLVVLIGGDGFFGTHIAQDLLERGARLRVVGRHPEKAFKLKPLANLGQLQFARCNVKDARSIQAAMRGADAAVYLVGAFTGDLKALQADGAAVAAKAAADQGARSFIYVSAIGADVASESAYASTKAQGEEKVREHFPNATILRPSVLFGEEDQFINMFAGLIRTFPLLPVFGPDAKLQPVWVDDAAAAVATALASPGAHGGKTYELAGPDVLTMEQLHRKIAASQCRQRTFVPMPDGLSGLFASLPGTPMTKDQWRMLKEGSVARGKLPGLKQLGIAPKPLDLFLDRWMTRYRKHGRFTDSNRMAGGSA